MEMAEERNEVRRRSNIRLALMLGLVALGFFVLIILNEL